MRDFYSILGVKRDAGADEIKAAWRTKAKSVHPDQNREDPNAHNRFAEMGRAYEVLKDPAKRSRYDQQRSKVEALEREQTIMQQRNAAREAAEKAKIAKANAERIMAELAQAEAEKAKAEAAAAQAAKAAQARAAQANAAKADKAKAKAAEDAAEKTSSEGTAAGTSGSANAGSDAGKAQNSASGSGAAAGATTGGSAKAEGPEDIVSRIFGDSPEAAAAAENLKRDQEASDINDGIPLRTPAPSLLAPIELLSSFVRRLRGTAPPPPPEKAPDVFAEAVVAISDLLEQKSVPITLTDGREVRVPLSGATEGHVVKLKGQGLKFQGLLRGDLAVTIRILRSERFLVDGYDIHAVLPITLENAVLGCETEVEGPEGPVKVTVPAWSNSDQSIRMEMLGLPDGNGGRGALVIELRVMLWEKPDEKVTDLMRLMREGLYL
jgi:DnaJ-class molecular chaperone